MKTSTRSQIYLIRNKLTGLYVGQSTVSIKKRGTIGRIFTNVSALKNHWNRRRYDTTLYEVVGFDLIKPEMVYAVEDL